MGQYSAETAAAINAAGQITAQGISAVSQANLNKRTRKWNEQRYDIERQHALQDWTRQNEYNSPLAQMQRFRDAGLNPNLIYGQTNEAPPVRSTDTQNWTPRAPEISLDPGSVIASYQNVKMQEAQIDALRSAITVQQQDALLKAMQTADISVSKGMKEFDLTQKQRLADTQAQVAQKNLEKLDQEIQSSKTSQGIALQENERRAALTSQSLQEGIERILQIRAQTANTREERQRIRESIKNLDKDTQLKNEDLELRKKGINPQDPVWLRMLGQYLEQYLRPTSPSTGKPFGALEKF